MYSILYFIIVIAAAAADYVRVLYGRFYSAAAAAAILLLLFISFFLYYIVPVGTYYITYTYLSTDLISSARVQTRLSLVIYLAKQQSDNIHNKTLKVICVPKIVCVIIHTRTFFSPTCLRVRIHLNEFLLHYSLWYLRCIYLVFLNNF